VEGLLEGQRSGRPAALTPRQREQLGDILDSGPVVTYHVKTSILNSCRSPLGRPSAFVRDRDTSVPRRKRVSRPALGHSGQVQDVI
jgi:hypothetical protein